MKKIYLEPAWKIHSFYQDIIESPPEGYEFQIPKTSFNDIIKSASRATALRALYKGVDRFVPMNLNISYLKMFNKKPKDTDLTFSTGHLIFRNEPWIVDVESPFLIGFNIYHLKLYRRSVENTLSSSHCKKVIFWFKIIERMFKSNFDCREFKEKMEFITPAVKEKKFNKDVNKDKIKFLFVGSTNIPGEFEVKGGRDVIETFIFLDQKYDDLELVVRSDVPYYFREMSKKHGNIKIIDKNIPWPLLEREFRSADIFMLPAYVTPWTAFLQAMSYQLPILTTDDWANTEIVDDGETGFVIKRNEKSRYCMGNFLIPSWLVPGFNERMKKSNRSVDELVEKASILIEDRKMREKMGKKARWEIEHGRFSIKNRNKNLKRVFDEATS